MNTKVELLRRKLLGDTSDGIGHLESRDQQVDRITLNSSTNRKRYQIDVP